MVTTLVDADHRAGRHRAEMLDAALPGMASARGTDLGLAGRSVANQLAHRWEGEQWSEHQLGKQESSPEMVTDESSTASQRQLLS